MKKLILSAFLIVVLGFSGLVNAALNDPVAYYPFDGDANDVSGNGYHGTVNGATLAADRFGNLDSAYRFDGDDYIAIPEFLSVDTLGITITAWVKVKPNTPHTGYIMYKGLQGEMVLRSESAGNYTFGVKMADGEWFFTNGGSIETGEFQHIVGVYYWGDRIDLWVDGVLASSTDISNLNLFYGMLPSAIGSYTLGDHGFFNGIIDEVAVYGRALSEAEIRALYNEGVPEPVAIDIKPDDDTNNINLRGKTVWVAIFSSTDFDAPSEVEVDRTTLTFGATGNELSLLSCATRKPKDINQDSLEDLACKFSIKDAGFQCGDTVGILKGKTVGGNSFEGSQAVVINPCK